LIKKILAGGQYFHTNTRAEKRPYSQSKIMFVFFSFKKINYDNVNKLHVLQLSFKREADSDERKVMLVLHSELAGMPFLWNFQCRPADKSMVRKVFYVKEIIKHVHVFF
jgi:hypothetical protein